MKTNVVALAKPLFPIPLYFFIVMIASEFMKKYTVVGPVGSESGQPIFSSFYNVVHYGFIILIALGLTYTFVQAMKMRGAPRYLNITVAVLSLPLQYLFAIAAVISVFGK